MGLCLAAGSDTPPGALYESLVIRPEQSMAL